MQAVITAMPDSANFFAPIVSPDHTRNYASSLVVVQTAESLKYVDTKPTAVRNLCSARLVRITGSQWTLCSVLRHRSRLNTIVSFSSSANSPRTCCWCRGNRHGQQPHGHPPFSDTCFEAIGAIRKSYCRTGTRNSYLISGRTSGNKQERNFCTPRHTIHKLTANPNGLCKQLNQPYGISFMVLKILASGMKHCRGYNSNTAIANCKPPEARQMKL